MKTILQFLIMFFTTILISQSNYIGKTKTEIFRELGVVNETPYKNDSSQLEFEKNSTMISYSIFNNKGEEIGGNVFFIDENNICYVQIEMFEMINQQYCIDRWNTIYHSDYVNKVSPIEVVYYLKQPNVKILLGNWSDEDKSYVTITYIRI